MGTVPTALKGISSMATRQLLAELVADWHVQGGEPVDIESVGGVDAARRVHDGEAFDVVFLASGAIAGLEAAGRVLAGSRVDLMRSSTAVAVPAGAATPDISSEEAVRAAVLAASGFVAFAVAKIDQGIQIHIGHRPHMAATATVATVWTAKFFVFFMPKRHAAIAAVTGEDVDIGFVYKFHGLPPDGCRWPPVKNNKAPLRAAGLDARRYLKLKQQQA